MTWIRTVPPAQAGAELASTYEKAASFSKHRHVSNLWQAWGGDAPGLETLHAHYRALMGAPAPLTPAQAEMVALVVSATNGCGSSIRRWNGCSD